MAAVDECPLCFGPYRDPHLLPCGHTFCSDCIEQLQPCLCPTCRAAFRRADVRRNFALSGMLEDSATRPSAPLDNASFAASSSSLIQPALSQALRVDPGQPLLQRSTKDGARQMSRSLTRFGASFGLARLICEEDQGVALRIFLLDNSGSTCTYDGKILEDEETGGKLRMTPCSRWEEIKQMALRQATINIAMGVACEFVLLNPAGRFSGYVQEGVDYVTINPSKGKTEIKLDELRLMLDRTRPQGPTPLRERITEIYQRIKREHGHLLQAGLSIVVVVATDGLPTCPVIGAPTEAARSNFVKALRSLTTDLPVFVVIRLCTDEDDVVDYYNRVDEEEELPLEVIDDIEGEAREVASKGNGWLAYSPLIHAIREGGTSVKLFDTLDERRLTPLEVRLLAGHLLQREDEAPLPIGDAQLFVRLAEQRLKSMPPVYNALKRSMGPCVNMSLLRRAIQAPPRTFRCFEFLRAALPNS
eukprot:TRINITY_DN62820_c0_g1_i1.p1 TRINITY_DN62820_c0_g1~~TRINITY_DN62820_c0_g1_i1.p1  ORF type:complete len:499 (-),score=67.06 TRINITY_DN62820_c0_g1_i1:153-1574(-)